jgi:hypothetical protein
MCEGCDQEAGLAVLMEAVGATVDTVDLDTANALPVGSIVADADPDLWVRLPHRWMCVTSVDDDDNEPWVWEESVDGPVRVLRVGDGRG